MEIRIGKVDKSCKEYGIMQAQLLYNSKPSQYKAIIKDNKLVAVLGKDYQVLPNRKAIDVAHEIAKELGAQEFKTVFSESGTRVYSSYLMQDKFEVIGKDKVNTGFTLQNGIDGTLAFSVSGFTYRSVCSNGVMLGYKKLASYFYRKHTSGFAVDLDKVMASVNKILERMNQALKNYAKLATLELNEEVARKIAESRLISRKLLPLYIKTEKLRLVEWDKTKTLWDVYNDITAKIWHNETTGIDSKRVQFNILHRIIEV